MLENWQQGGFGIYVHWPFCEAKCPYCDFNSHVARFIDQDLWRESFLKEIDRYAEEVPGRVVNSIFFGGGTPSLMDPSTVAAIIDRVAEKWTIANDIEITLEANPSSVEAQRFSDYRRGGVNRVSLGVQALNDADLRKLGRLHDAKEARAAMEIAQANFDRASFDLIYARQDQTIEDWEAELQQALSFGFSHLSLYQLTIEEGTAFGDRYRRGKLGGLPEDDLAADMYDLTVDICQQAGLPRYEVSNFAATGEESRHNMIYWRYGDYIGIGPGAHGRLSDRGRSRFAIEAPRSPQTWLSSVKDGKGQEKRFSLSAEDQGNEFLLMGLRMQDGVDLDRYRSLSGVELPPENLWKLQEDGIIQIDGIRLIVQKQYVSVLNTVLRELLRD